MPAPTTSHGDQYSSWTGLAYVFNLIVGTGALTLPAAFASAGWLLSSFCIITLAFFSYITAGWMVESMACANAITHWRRVKQLKKRGHVPDELVCRTLENAAECNRNCSTPTASTSGVQSTGGMAGTSEVQNISGIQPAVHCSPEDRDSSPASSSLCSSISHPPLPPDITSSEDPDEAEEAPLIREAIIERTVGDYYAIQECVEMGHMARLFYGKVWVKLFYAVLCVYLYGDLAIYEVAVAKSIRDIACTYVPPNCSQELLDQDPCFPHSDYSRLDVYRIAVCCFVGLMGPFVFFNLTKTKYMQIVTTITRWIALVVMITWALVIIAGGTSNASPPVARWRRLPDLFGVCVYSFMCHHSLPSLITPIASKGNLFRLLAADYLLILLFYLLLAFTGIFAFSHVEDLYTLNFQPDPCRQGQPHSIVYYLQMFLLLFPVFTLSTNFPIISITLRNNLKGLMLRECRRYSFFTTHLLFPLLAVLPPTLIALVTSNVEVLVGLTGAYAGSIIQYVVPATLVFSARRKTLQRIGLGVRNPFMAPMRHNNWLYLIAAWALLCWILVTFDQLQFLL